MNLLQSMLLTREQMPAEHNGKKINSRLMKNVRYGCAVYDSLCLVCADLDVDLDEVTENDFDACVDALADYIALADDSTGSDVCITFDSDVSATKPIQLSETDLALLGFALDCTFPKGEYEVVKLRNVLRLAGLSYEQSNKRLG